MSTAVERAYAAFDQDDAALALVLFEQEDKSGSGQAAHMLGWIHETGWHVPADAQAALTYYRRAAERGNALGSVSLGRKLLQMNQIPEWHLLRPASMTVLEHMTARVGARDFQPRVGLGSSLFHSRLDAPGPSANCALGDQCEQPQAVFCGG